MDGLGVSGGERVGLMSAAALDERGARLDVARRVAEAETALFLLDVDASAGYALDGHRRASLWGGGTKKWAGAGAARLLEMARAVRGLAVFGGAAPGRRGGIAPKHCLAAGAPHPPRGGALPGA